MDAGNTMAQYNMVKEALFDALVKENMMKQEVADALKENYAVIVTRKNWLGRFIDRVLYGENSKEDAKIVVVRIVK